MKVISWKQLPTRLPMQMTIVWGLLLDRLNAPAWLWGAFGCLFLLIWAATIHLFYKQEATEIKL